MSSRSPEEMRFSRDNEQLLALNYENTCDWEYLNRLFIVDANNHEAFVAPPSSSVTNLDGSPGNVSNVNTNSVQGGVNNTQSSHAQVNETTPMNNGTSVSNNIINTSSMSDNCILTPDIAEDLLIFSDETKLGCDFLKKRFLLYDISSISSYQDSLSGLIHRQIAVFKYIGGLVVNRCDKSVVVKQLGSVDGSKGVAEDSTNHLVPEALLCMLRAMEMQSKICIKQSVIEPILSLIINILQRYSSYSVSTSADGSNGETSDKKLSNKSSNSNNKVFPLSPMHMQYLRSILCNGTVQGINTCSYHASIQSGNYKEIEENMKLALSCTYGLLSLGVYAKNAGDISVSLSHLLSLMLLGEELTEVYAQHKGEALNINSSDVDSPTVCEPPVMNLPIQKLKMKSKLVESRTNVNKSTLSPFPTSIPNNIDSNESMVLEDSREFCDSNHGKLDIIGSIGAGTDTSPIVVSAKSKISLLKNKNYELEDANPQTVVIGRVSVTPSKQITPVINNASLSNKKKLALSKISPSLSGKPQNDNSENSTIMTSNKSSNNNQSPSPSPSSKRHHSREQRDILSRIHSLLRIPKSILKIVQESNLSLEKSNFLAFKSLNSLGTMGNNHSSITKSYVWSTGQNTHGELGHSDINQRRNFVKVSALDESCIVSLGAGNEHSIFVTKSGKMYVSGYNDNGQCGVGTTQTVRSPTILSSLTGEDVIQAHAYNGCEHTLAVTRDGKLFSFGYNYRGQLGLGTTSSESIPRAIKSLFSRKVVYAACSYHHSVVMCSDGTLFSFGRNDCGQLGHGDTLDKKSPQIITTAPKSVCSISCGQFFTTLVTASGSLYVCGKNDYGQLGFESAENIKSFTKLTGSYEVENARQVCCGYYHTLVLSHNGLVVGFGRNDYGQLGIGNTQLRVYGCNIINGLRDKNVISISAGCYHSIAATLNGMLYVFGRNNHGQLGSGDLEERHSPHPVDDFIGRRIICIAAGFYHTLILTAPIDGLEDESPMNDMNSNLIPANIYSQSYYEHDNNKTLLQAESPIPKSTKSPDKDTRASTVNDKGYNQILTPKGEKGVFSLDYRTKLGLSKLFNQVVIQLEHVNNLNIVHSSNTQANTTGTSYCSNKVSRDTDDSWLIRQMDAYTEMMHFNRQIFSDNNNFIDSVISIGESYSALRTLLHSVETFLSEHKLSLSEIAQLNDQEVEVNVSDALKSSTVQAIRSTDFIYRIHTSADNFSTINTANSVDGSSNIVFNRMKRVSISKLRRELLLLYLSIPSYDPNVTSDAVNGSTNSNVHNSFILQDTGSCISKCFEILFYSPSLKADFFAFMSDKLPLIRSICEVVPADTLDLVDDRVASIRNILQLFGRICFKYRGINEVIKLFQSSTRYGLEIFHSMLIVYNHLSLLCLEAKAHTHINSPLGSEVCRVMTALEHCNINFVKCAVPIIFDGVSDSSSADQHGNLILEYAVRVIDSIFNGAETVLDMTSKMPQPLNPELMNILRSGTVIPSILPTLLLFAMSNSSSFMCMTYVRPRLVVLIEKLNIFSKFELTSGNSSSPKNHDSSLSMDAVDNATTFQDHADNNYINSATVKDGSIPLSSSTSFTVPWWGRLLKLSVFLCAKLATSACFQIVNQVMSQHVDTDVTVYHSIWSYVSGPSHVDSNEVGTSEEADDISIEHIDLCKNLRIKYSISDHTYRVLNSGQSNTLGLEGVENIIFDTVLFINHHYKSMANNGKIGINPLIERDWRDIVRFSKIMNGRKSTILNSLQDINGGHLDNLSWKNILRIIKAIAIRVRKILISTTVQLQCNNNLPCIQGKSGVSRAKSALRRCMLIIVCLHRWKLCKTHSLIRVGSCVVDFFHHIFRIVTSNFTLFELSKITTRINSITSTFVSMNDTVLRTVDGFQTMKQLMCDSSSFSIKTDLVATLVSMMTTKIDRVDDTKWTDDHRFGGYLQKLLSGNFCCSCSTRGLLVTAFNGMFSKVLTVITEFLDKYNSPQAALAVTVLELNLLLLSLKLIHFMSIQGVRYRKSSDTQGNRFYFPVKLYHQLFYVLDDKPNGEVLNEEFGSTSAKGPSNDINYSAPTNAENNGGSNSAPIANNQSGSTRYKYNTTRDRNRALRRVTNEIISILQEFSICEAQDFDASDFVHRSTACSEVVSIQCSLISSLQKCNTISSSDIITMDNEPNLSGASGIPFVGLQSKESKDGKKRCQELLNNPVEFCRSQEGFVVQGDKLLNNYKGIDFTLVTWVLISKKLQPIIATNTRNTSFITGKISHNDAWPIVALRNDKKLEIIYGHGNEFERITSQVTIPINVWTHIAVVVEPKKIKLFINGAVDSQVVTKGNARAILYPVVVGTCPQGLRTRVEYVKDGFDGFLAQYKYYTRALSPIHIRVVYDQGPPESYDIREKWSYQLMASINAVINMNICQSLCKQVVRQIADTMMLVFITDTIEGRLRNSALKILEQLLKLDLLADVNLYSGRNEKLDSYGVHQLMTICTSNAKEFTSFRERMVYYLLRVIGACWLPSLIDAFHSTESSTTHNVSAQEDDLTAFLRAVPGFVGDKVDLYNNRFVGSLHSQSLANGFIDGKSQSEEALGELNYKIVSILRNLSLTPVWSESISLVAVHILQSSIVSIKQMLPCGDSKLSLGSDVMTSISKISLLGVSVLFGESYSLPYVGADVVNYFGDSVGTVLNINRTTRLATLLSWNNLHTKRQLLSIRMSDLSGSWMQNMCHSTFPTKPIIETVIDLLDTLKPFVLLSLSDILCLYRPDHLFLRSTMIRLLRPLEVFIFNYLLVFVNQQLNNTSPGNANTGFLVSEIKKRKELLALLLHAAIRTLRMGEDGIDKNLFGLWCKNARYLNGNTGKVKLSTFPALESERSLSDYITKQLGLSVETFQGTANEKLLKSGLLNELLYSIAVSNGTTMSHNNSPALSNQDVVNSLLNIFMLDQAGREEISPTLMYVCNEWTTTSVCNASNVVSNSNSPFDSNDVDATNSLKLVHQLRRMIILCCRDMLSCISSNGENFVSLIDTELLETLHLPIKLLLWQVLCKNEKIGAPTIGNMHSCSTAVITSFPVIHNMLRHLATEYAHEVSYSLTSSIRYAAISLLQSSSSKSSYNLLETTDLFTRILHASYIWIQYLDTFPHSSIDLYQICFNYLKILLPSLSFVESSDIELLIMNLCRRVLYKICSKLLHYGYESGQGITKDLLELARSNNFILLHTRAQEEVARNRGNVTYNASLLLYNLTQLSSGLEIVQRYGVLHQFYGTFCDVLSTIPSAGLSGGSPVRMIFGNKSIPAATFSPLLQCRDIETPAPKVVNVRCTSVDIDLSECIGTLALPSFIKDSGALSSSFSDCVLIEVALGVVLDGEESLFDTVYYGTSTKFVQAGLAPNCTYVIKCRIIIGNHEYHFKWSKEVQFVTDIGVLFTFDNNKCGLDILLSDDGLTASYAGDDCWSALLGTRSFSSGITTWEIRITQSSTAYIFVGVATAMADLNTFLGGCSNGWGFIGEQALYHNRDKVKGYGDSFSAGDIIGVVLDLKHGTMSFTKNGKMLGVAFDKMFGELYPAVAFYNVGQEIEILIDSFRTTCPHESLPCSPSSLTINDISVISEIMLCISSNSLFSPRILSIILNHANEWCASTTIRSLLVSGRNIFILTKSELLSYHNLIVGEKVRTPFGISEVIGSAYNCIWFKHCFNNSVWYFTKQQILSGKEKGMFLRCTYNVSVSIDNSMDSTSSSLLDGSTNDTVKITDHKLSFDSSTIQELLDSSKWNDDMDAILTKYLLNYADTNNIDVYEISVDMILSDFRTVQSLLSRVVMGNTIMSHRWGIGGPKRKAVIARISMLRLFNHFITQYLPIMLLDDGINNNHMNTHLESLLGVLNYNKHRFMGDSNPAISAINHEHDYNPIIVTLNNSVVIPRGNEIMCNNSTLSSLVSLSWAKRVDASASILSTAPLLRVRQRIFSDLKLTYFWDIVHKSTARTSKTDDDYDYPEDLPQIKINRLKSFRAKEASQLLHIPGEDLILSSIFCQLWKELRAHPSEKLRISYSHPMDDGQSRTFKIKFDAEGVDDYGGPYREIFQQVCDELQCIESHSASLGGAGPAATATSENGPLICYLPLLHPTPNWGSDVGDCDEKYKYIFHPSANSPLKLDLFKFLGELTGVAIRSKITLDLAFPSFIWKLLVRESVTELDIKSFDLATANFITHLGNLSKSLNDNMFDNKAKRETILQELLSLLQDLSWTATRCDGRIVELVNGGKDKPVTLDNLESYLLLLTEYKINENILAIETFRSGLVSVIPEEALLLMSWDELQTIVCGTKTIDIQRLYENTEYDDDVSPDDAHIILFWEVLREFSEAEKSKFLRFVWARPTLPPKGVEFPQKFKVQSAVGDDATEKPDTYLPKAHTCFFSINLPRYTSKTVIREKLLYAINNCTEMDADFRLQDTDVNGWNNIV